MLHAELMGTVVEIGAISLRIGRPLVSGPGPGGSGHLRADRSRAILRIPNVGKFAVEDGRRVRFDPTRDVEPGIARGWLNGAVASLLLAQRGCFALHASVVVIGGKAIALTGRRGAGKSTTALALVQAGHSLLTDDVAPLEPGRSVIVEPFDRPALVPRHTAVRLQLDLSEAEQVAEGHPKVALRFRPEAARALRAIAVLRPERSARMAVSRVQGSLAHAHVGANVYRRQLLAPLYGDEMFAWANAVASRVPVHVITRPTPGWTVDAVAETVEGVAGLAEGER